MMVFSYYLLKVIACSGILFLYYLIFLKNRHLHVWNRFYLILLFLISVILPLIHITIQRPVYEQLTNKGTHLLKAVETANQFFEETNAGGQATVPAGKIMLYSYIFISIL